MKSLKIKIQMLLKLFPIIIVLVMFLKGSKSDTIYSLETRYIDVPVDHFSAMGSYKTFKLRYLLNGKHYIKGGPVFIYTGGERDITIAAQNTGFLFDIAPIFKAMLVFVEHRYYGKSLPFGNASFSTTENLRYLSTTQALADFSFLIDDLKGKIFENVTSSKIEPFIAFGGYYAGMLSAWLRMKYPFSVRGALTSSAPIFYFPGLTTCEGYYQIVTDMFEKHGQEQCVKTIKLGWDIIINQCKTKLGMDLISSTWKLCNKIRTPEDVNALLDWLANIYVKLSMTNYHYPSDYYKPVPAYPVKIFCEKLTTTFASDTKGLIQSFANALEVYTNYTGKTICNNIYHKQEDFNEIAWQYQTCTELIMPKCSTDNDMFITKQWNYTQFVLECYETFGAKLGPDWALLAYGGKNLQYYSNILFSNSMLDPGSWGGVYMNKSNETDESLMTYEIIDAPHLVDLRGSDTADNNYLVQARNVYVSTLKKWLKLE
ncbi:unnamed protein product [Psylliodes chrysocephalus]|uniref:Lysosomal Pro-X carboxypeptidase n=1 Tax=Psylliodes chrysocephalus TaxID=3402493 RepID=A0A9P0GGQ9_9CUCU|nr:unnamed protein product [Psylliodes chrysocephala]